MRNLPTVPRAPTKKKDRKAAQRGPKAGKKTTLKAATGKAPLGERMVRQAPTEQTVPADQRPTITTILWTIYLNPADAPGQAVLRPHACLRDGRVLAGTRSWIRPTVADCRALIPKSAKRLNVADPDKTIQEVWMQNIGSGASAGDQTGR